MQLGTIQGDVDTSTFTFRATEEVKKFDFVSVKSNGKWILAQIEKVTKHPDGKTEADANIIGYREKGLTKAPRRVIEPDSIVYRADQELISDTLGLKETGLRIGNLETDDEIDIFVNGEDFYKHFAVLAQTGAGKCVTSDTEVLLSDGSLAEIKDIFESSNQVVKSSDGEELRILDNCSVKALDNDYTHVDADALYAYRKKADRVLRILTSSGREVEVTPEHPLLSAENGYEFLVAEELEEGDHIAVPRKLETSGSANFDISDDLNDLAQQESERRQEAQKKYRKFCEMDGNVEGLTEIEESISISKSTLENWKYQESKPAVDNGMAVHQNSKGIQVPETFDADFAEFLSLIIAEGTEQKADGSYRIIFTNNDLGLMEDFANHVKSLFGLETNLRDENSRYVDSTSLEHLLEDIGYETLQKSRGKDIPEIVLSSPRECKRRFLSVFFDAEGCMEDHEVTLSSASEDIINKLSYMLLEFGIVARMSESEKRATNSGHDGDIYYKLSISGVKHLEKFYERIGFRMERKQNKLEEYLRESEGNTNTDIVPIDGEYLKLEREKVGISQRELSEKIESHSTLVSLYERNERRPSRQNFKELASTLDSQLYQELADSDIYWDKIESIEKVDYDGYVYDLTVREHHNFVAGKGGIVCHNSYLTGVLIEELLQEDYPVLIIDPHGEYHSLAEPNPDSDEARDFDVTEYSPNTDINSTALPMSFSSKNLEKKELMSLIPDSLTNSQMGVLYNSLKRLRDKDEDYNLTDLMDAVSQEDSSAKWNLLNSLEQLEDTGLFSQNPTDLEGLVQQGEASIINLKAVEPEATEMTMYMLAKKLFDLRKKNRIPPFLMVIEEAHNFAPEKGFEQAQSNKILRKIASEGRKFGLGMGVISQRPARIDKNVLSQCNTQFILRVTNPNDLKAISKSFEGITSEVEGMIKSLPPGVCFVLGNEYPVMTDVRTRKSLHGGTTQTQESYTEKTKVEYFEPEKSIEELENETGEKYSVAYYPLYWIENEEKQILLDGVKGEIKAEREKPSGTEQEIFEKMQEGLSKAEIMEELDIGITKVSSLIDSLRSKGVVSEEGAELKDTVLNLDTSEERVEADKVIDFEIDGEKAESWIEDAEVSKKYYPYFSKGEEVYDPVQNKEV